VASRPERRLSRIEEHDLTLKRARRLIALLVIVFTTGGGIAVRFADPHNFPNIGLAMWWSLQTVTTVGYGDVVPTTVAGRLVGAGLMVLGIGFITVITAVITSAFAQSAARRLGREPDDPVLREVRELRASVDALRTELGGRPSG
jgi:voltage-gated potassium channel